MKHTELFLVRIWLQDLEDETPEGSTPGELRGIVQRTVDGERHSFHDWQGLLTSLTAMLRADEIDADMLLSPTDTESPSQEISPESKEQ